MFNEYYTPSTFVGLVSCLGSNQTHVFTPAGGKGMATTLVVMSYNLENSPNILENGATGLFSVEAVPGGGGKYTHLLIYGML